MLNIGIISRSGAGDLIQNLYYLKSIDDQFSGLKTWTFFIKFLDLNCADRSKILEKFLGSLFWNEIDVNLVFYDPRDEKNIHSKAVEMCDWVFDPMATDSNLREHFAPSWLIPTSLHVIKEKVCQTQKNVRKIANKDMYSNCSVFCHLYSGTRGEARNLPFEARNRIGKALFNNFGQYNVSFFAWDDPDVEKYDFPVIENTDMIEIFLSRRNQLYIGVDSWVHSLFAGENDWICWTEKEWKANTQRVSSKVFVKPGFRKILASHDVDRIVDEVSALMPI